MLHFSENYVILASALLSQYTRVTDRQTTTDDRRQTTSYDANSGTCNAIQLQRSAKKVEI